MSLFKQSTSRRLFVGAIALAAGLALSGCGGGGSGDEPVSPPAQGANFQMKDHTHLVDATTATLLAQDDLSMTLRGNISKIAIGDIIVSTLGDGALRRVTAITQLQDGIRFSTEQAALYEAFSRFDLDLDRVLTPADLGDTFDTGDPELTLKWAPQATALHAHPSAVNGPTLELSYNGYGASSGISVDGAARFQLAPNLSMNLDYAVPGLLPRLEYSASINPAYSHELTVSSEYGGSVSMEKETGDVRIGRIVIPDPPIVIVPVLEAKARVTGTAAGKFSAIHTASINGLASISRGADGITKTDVQYQPLAKGEFTSAEGSLAVEMVPADVRLNFKFYGIGGPYFGLAAVASGKGTFQKDGSTGKEGILAELDGKLTGSLGVGGGLDFLKRLFSDLDGDFTLVNYNFDIYTLLHWEKFFPFMGDGSIVVRDNGNVADDIFEVAVDGVVLGRTSKGGSGQFRVSSLRPGAHSLRLTTIEDDSPPGTWEISLADGITFDDGSTSKSGGLSLGQFETFGLVVPTP